MEPNFVTAAERLALLLPWINGDADDPGPDVDRFLASMSGDFLGLVPEPHGTFTERQWSNLRADILRLLEPTEEPPDLDPVWGTGGVPEVRSLPSLRFGVSRVRAKPAKQPTARVERGEVNGPGAFRMTVRGRYRDVVLYAVMRTLTEEGAVILSRCPAPAPGDWSQRCGRYLITGRRVGRPQEYCSDACRVRANRERRG